MAACSIAALKKATQDKMSSACHATTEMIADKKRIHLSILTVAFCLFPCMMHAQKVAVARIHDDPVNHGNDVGLLLGLYFPNQRSISWHDLAGGKWVPEPAFFFRAPGKWREIINPRAFCDGLLSRIIVHLT